MTPEELRRIATETALELPQARLTFPFGDEWEVYKVVDRMFLLLTESTGPQMVTLKVEPREGRALVEAYDDVIPGYHLNKTHWATILAPIDEGGAATGEDDDEGADETPKRLIPAEELKELIVSSYLLVVANLAKKDRPVDPFVYGRAHDERGGVERREA